MKSETKEIIAYSIYFMMQNGGGTTVHAVFFQLQLNACHVYFRLSKVMQNQYPILCVYFSKCNGCGSIYCATKFLRICSLMKFLVLWLPLFAFLIYSCCS